MNINNVAFLLSKGFIARKNDNGNEIYHLNSPCSIKISAKVVASIQENYKINEEIGGILWLTPILSSTRSFKVEKISFIRNAIEDNARLDYRNKSNAYLPDYSESSKVLKEIFDSNSLPIIFHTHPIHGTDYFTKILSSSIQTETSDADRSESNRLLTYENNNYFLPRALIVGNQVKKNNLFMGVYGGHIAPLTFEESKHNIIVQNIDRFIARMSLKELDSSQKLLLGIGAFGLAYMIYKYPKYSVPAIVALSALAALNLTDTKNIDKPAHFCRLSDEEASFIIP